MRTPWKAGDECQCAYSTQFDGTASSSQAVVTDPVVNYEFFGGMVVDVSVEDPSWPDSTWAAVEVRLLSTHCISLFVRVCAGLRAVNQWYSAFS